MIATILTILTWVLTFLPIVWKVGSWLIRWFKGASLAKRIVAVSAFGVAGGAIATYKWGLGGTLASLGGIVAAILAVLPLGGKIVAAIASSSIGAFIIFVIKFIGSYIRYGIPMLFAWLLPTLLPKLRWLMDAIFFILKNPLFYICVLILNAYFPTLLETIFGLIGVAVLKVAVSAFNAIYPSINDESSSVMSNIKDTFADLKELPDCMLAWMGYMHLAENIGMIVSALIACTFIRLYINWVGVRVPFSILRGSN